jgi:cytochrome P450
MAYMTYLYETYGSLVSLGRGTTDFIFIFDPAYNYRFFTETDLFYTDDFSSMPFVPDKGIFKQLTYGLHLINGEKHRQQRRLMMPPFHNKRLVTYRDTMVDLTERQLHSWRPGQEREIFREMKQLSMAIGIKTLLGLDPDQEGRLVGEMVDDFMTRLFSIPSLLLRFEIPGLPYYQMVRRGEAVVKRLQAMIERKRAHPDDSGDVLSTMLQVRDEDGSRLSDSELIGQSMTIFRGAYPSTTLALVWTLLLLAQHPDQLADLQDELTGLLHGEAPTAEQLKDLPLLDGAIRETMRLLPPALWTIRRAISPFTLGPYDLPAETHLLASAFVTHRQPDLYPNPRRFDSHRWLHLKPSAYEYFPFSAGPRLCLGATFAMMSMKIILAILLQRYELRPRPHLKIDCGGIRGPEVKHPLPMIITPVRNRLGFKQPITGNIRTLIEFED